MRGVRDDDEEFEFPCGVKISRLKGGRGPAILSQARPNAVQAPQGGSPGISARFG